MSVCVSDSLRASVQLSLYVHGCLFSACTISTIARIGAAMEFIATLPIRDQLVATIDRSLHPTSTSMYQLRPDSKRIILQFLDGLLSEWTRCLVLIGVLGGT